VSEQTTRVLRCLAFGHARGVIDVVDRLGKARVTVTREQVEDALIELLEAGLVTGSKGQWQRV